MSEMTKDQVSEFTIAAGKTFPWHELYVADGEAGRKFYVDALGWEAEDAPMGGEMGPYKMLKANGSGIGGVMGTANQPGMENVPAHWSVYISVDDVDARLAKCTSLGGTVMVPPMDIPNVGRMALIQDPQGATFWLFKSAPM